MCGVLISYLLALLCCVHLQYSCRSEPLLCCALCEPSPDDKERNDAFIGDASTGRTPGTAECLRISDAAGAHAAHVAPPVLAASGARAGARAISPAAVAARPDSASGAGE